MVVNVLLLDSALPTLLLVPLNISHNPGMVPLHLWFTTSDPVLLEQCFLKKKNVYWVLRVFLL